MLSVKPRAIYCAVFHLYTMCGIIFLAKEQSVYFAGAREDEWASGHSAAETAEKLYVLCAGKKELRLFDGEGHGSAIFERNPDFMDALAEWIGRQ